MNQIKLFFLLFIFYSFIGWIIETLFILIVDKKLVNRGFLIGPILPIYGSCSVLMILLLSKFNSVTMLFLMSVLLCSASEYLTSFIMEKIFKARWWDYSNRKYNINGRICLTNALLFGILGFILIKFVNENVYKLYNVLNKTTINYLFYILFILFILDLSISCKILFKIKNMSNKYLKADNTKEIKEKVKNTINNNFLVKRLLNAFPNIKMKIENTYKNIKNVFKV